MTRSTWSRNTGRSSSRCAASTSIAAGATSITSSMDRASCPSGSPRPASRTPTRNSTTTIRTSTTGWTRACPSSTRPCSPKRQALMSDSNSAPLPLAGRPAAMRFIMLTALIDMVSIGLIIPVLPVLVGNFTASLAEQAFWYGAVMITFAVVNFFGAPVLGALSDRCGRRPILLIGFCGLACSLFVTALATQLWMLIAVRLVSGALMANMSVANAYVADITPPEDRARRFGQLGATMGLGFILGPAMGGLLGGSDI